MLKLEYKEYVLDFKFDAGTSRGILKHHKVIFLKLYDPKDPVVYGLGEAAPLEGLSIETAEEVLTFLETFVDKVKKWEVPGSEEAAFHLVNTTIPQTLPSLKFGMETALLDLLNGGKRVVFNNDFQEAKKDIPINGLIWMGNTTFMREQIESKVNQGFKCIKMKVGAMDFESELGMVEFLRSKSDKISIRLDANGAFPNNEVFSKLTQLEKFNIHSIEQPIMPKQPEAMQLICKRSPIPVALDEELIGVGELSQKMELLKLLRPKYIILKPSLLGGIYQTREWIRIADQFGIGWWFTSALESNVGLNAIAQFTAQFPVTLPQGLGTGQLYENNIESPLEVNGSYLGYNLQKHWSQLF